MPRSEPVTREQVYAAADELRAQGNKPSLVNVRERVRGSYTTIQAYLAEWAKERQPAPPSPVDVPLDLAAKGTAFVEQLWMQAAQEAEQRIAHREAEAAARVDTAESARADAEAEISRQETEIEQQAEQIAVLTEQFEAQAAALRAAEHDRDVAEARVEEQGRQLAMLQQEVESLRNVQLEMARQEGELRSLREQLAQQTALIERRMGTAPAAEQKRTTKRSLTSNEQDKGAQQ